MKKLLMSQLCRSCDDVVGRFRGLSGKKTIGQLLEIVVDCRWEVELTVDADMGILDSGLFAELEGRRAAAELFNYNTWFTRRGSPTKVQKKKKLDTYFSSQDNRF